MHGFYDQLSSDPGVSQVHLSPACQTELNALNVICRNDTTPFTRHHPPFFFFLSRFQKALFILYVFTEDQRGRLWGVGPNPGMRCSSRVLSWSIFSIASILYRTQMHCVVLCCSDSNSQGAQIHVQYYQNYLQLGHYYCLHSWHTWKSWLPLDGWISWIGCAQESKA